MGTPPTEAQREPQETLHHVPISRPFYLAIHEVTQREWRTVMGSNPVALCRVRPRLSGRG